MTIRPRTLVPLFALLLTAPTVALADSEWHLTGGEVGYSYHPDHARSAKGRADAPSKKAAPGKTREEVLKELRDVTPEERARMRELYSGG